MSDYETFCELNSEPDYSAVQIVEIDASGVQDYRQGMSLADVKAEELLGDYMLLSWYDRDRAFASPQHSSACHLDQCGSRLC